MDARHTQRVEQTIDASAAAALAAAGAFAALRLGFSPILAAAVASASFLGGFRMLTSIEAKAPAYALAGFEVASLPEPTEVDELLLTDADRVPYVPAAADELLLEDVLTKIADESRVVRLFDPAAMPSPGELKDRIDSHLDSDSSAAAYPDASKALLDALSELRRSLH